MTKNEEERERVLVAGRPDLEQCRNQVITSRYTALTFLPMGIFEQFRRVANLYFLVIGVVMFIGEYTSLFNSVVNPITVLFPLSFVIFVSLLQEGLADLGRHRSDSKVNNHPCIIFGRSKDVGAEKKRKRDDAIMDGKDVNIELDDQSEKNCGIAFESIKRMNIRQGHLVLIRNRDMIPADIVLLASSSDNGNVYIETSSIDGETNLKLRSSPNLPKEIMKKILDGSDNEGKVLRETLEEATRRVCRLSTLAFPQGKSSIDNPYNRHVDESENGLEENTPRSAFQMMKNAAKSISNGIGEMTKHQDGPISDEGRENRYVMALKSEPPNASVNTFNGVLFLPPIDVDGPSVEVPLSADNFLLRGAVLRNTEWAIGFTCYTGDDTKLVRNSFETPSKLSRLDELTNRTVFCILGIMFLLIAYLATATNLSNNAHFDELWYAGFSRNPDEKWPYLPKHFGPPKWQEKTQNWFQLFFTTLTAVSQFVPVTLYVTVEIVTFAMRFLINSDLKMYDPLSDTRSIARSTTVTDPGQVEYIFSDKTGTLTQNVMTFTRCSVDGAIFGAPVMELSRTASKTNSSFTSLGSFLEYYSDRGGVLTFNREMFLRVMSLCHTVVVEKDLDNPPPPTSVENTIGKDIENRDLTKADKGRDGAPIGFAYQAESPDEGALVEAASLEFGFQVASRDSSGIKLLVSSSTIFSDDAVVEKLKNGSLTEETLAADTASPEGRLGSGATTAMGAREELWEVLAVNKFDSTRKRMSVLVRSPPELGSIPMLLCKGADSAMLNPTIVKDPSHIVGGDENAKTINERGNQVENSVENAYDIDSNLSLQSHLGEFAREGLRTLVLGVRILSEKECSDWLEEYQEAATSIKNRDELLTAAAMSIESKLHIVGATAIEDKLQVGVPDTIDLLGKAGIKLWVLTGDKRETAKEIGYATKVLTEKMRDGLIEVAQASTDEVRTIMAMAFLKLVKHAKLPEYQTAAVSMDTAKPIETFLFKFGKFRRRLKRARRRFWHRYVKVFFWYITCRSNLPEEDPVLLAIDEEEKKEEGVLQVTERRRNVRNRAEKIARDYLNTSEGMAGRRNRSNISLDEEISVEDLDMPSSGPDVFDKARSAGAILKKLHQDEKKPSYKLEKLTKEKLAASYGSTHNADDQLVIDEDLLSMKSVPPSDGEEDKKKFDKHKRTPLEMVFSTDTSVRHGRLVKHLAASVLASINENRNTGEDTNFGEAGAPNNGMDGPRALVIEGAALEHLLGDDELEELLFAVANTCDSVIACRVSPAQKAQLVQLVRRYVVPEPVTLAIGDGANDVGMIQEAHVGVGISGKEGQQAVNASDFAIAQFRFLEDLTLIHGRWNFMRMSTLVLYIFYKNAVMVLCMVIYFGETMYSGTLLFDQWVVSTFNIVSFLPITFLGIFDRCLDKDYVKENPDVYNPTRRNELVKKRSVARWGIICLIHMWTLYFFSLPALARDGGGSTSAFLGMMTNTNVERPGDGEVGDLKTVGFAIFTCVIIIMCLKVAYESKSIIIGQFPSCTCSKSKGEGWGNRLNYTWIGIVYLSFLIYIAFMYVYSMAGQSIINKYLLAFLGTVNHAFQTSTKNWMVILLVPVTGMVFDISLKVFGNLFYPTQTQIHSELFVKGLKKKAC